MFETGCKLPNQHVTPATQRCYTRRRVNGQKAQILLTFEDVEPAPFRDAIDPSQLAEIERD
jgi:hypothetical protein